MAYPHTYFPSSFFPGRYFPPLADAEAGAAALGGSGGKGIRRARRASRTAWSSVISTTPPFLIDQEEDEDAVIAMLLELLRA